jgi:hypothetical protein
MKRILMVVLTVVLALSVATTAYAGQLNLGGKEAGASAYVQGAAAVNSSAYIKIGSVDFVDGSFTFHLTDLQVSYSLAPPSSSSSVSINTDYTKWYATTGGDGIVFTFSNDRSKWVPYLGFLKPAGKINTDSNDYRVKWLATGSGVVAGLNTNFNIYESALGVRDMNLSVSTAFGAARIAGFVGDFNGTDYYGADVTFTDVLAEGDLMAGVYANKGAVENGLAYRVDLAGLKAGSVTFDANYQFGNAYVQQAATWKDGNVPTANKKEFYAKAVLPFTFFDFPSTLTGEFTRYMAAGTNKFKITDVFDISDSIKAVTLVAELGSAVNDNYSAEATILPGVEGLTVYPKVSKTVEGSPVPDLKFETEAEYKFGDTRLLGGFIYQGGLDRYYAFGDSKAVYGTLNTQVAGLYLKRDIKTTAKTYTRAYLSAATDLTEYLTGVGAKFLYLKDNTDDAKTIAAIGGNYAVSADTTLTASYLFKNAAAGLSHFYLAITKTVGSATFTLSYGGSKNYKDVDDIAAVHEFGFKKWITMSNVPWGELLGVDVVDTDRQYQRQIKASVTVPF